MGSLKRDLLVFLVILLVISDNVGGRFMAKSDSEVLRSKILLRSNIDKAFQEDDINMNLTNLAILASPRASVEGYDSQRKEQNHLGSLFAEYRPDTKTISEKQIVIPQVPLQLQNILAAFQPNPWPTTTASSTAGSSPSTTMESSSTSTDTTSESSTTSTEASSETSSTSTTSSAASTEMESSSVKTETSSDTSTTIESSTTTMTSTTPSSTSTTVESSSASTETSSDASTTSESGTTTTTSTTPSSTSTTVESSSASTETSPGATTETSTTSTEASSSSSTTTTATTSFTSTGTASTPSSFLPVLGAFISSSSGPSKPIVFIFPNARESSGNTERASERIPDDLHAIITTQHGFDNISIPNRPPSGLNPFTTINVPQTGSVAEDARAIKSSPIAEGASNHQLQQLIDSIESNKGSKIRADQRQTFFQQLSSQFGSNNGNQGSGSNPLSPITSKFQNVGSQITGGFTNATNTFVGSNNDRNQTSGSNAVGAITPQIQSVIGGVNNVTNQFENVGSQISGGLDNATSAITGSNSNAGIQNQLQQLINTLQPNQGSKPPASQQSDTFFQQLGSQFGNAFASNNGNQSSGSNPLSPITSQFQNVGSQITGGLANATNAFTGSINNDNETSGLNPVGGITSQIQSVGSQIAGGVNNVTNQFENVGSQITGGFDNATSAITGSNTNAGIQSQLQQLINSLQPNQGSKPPASQQSDTFFQQLGSQFGNAFASNKGNQSSGSNPLSPITSQFQNVGSQITGGLANATNAFTGSINNANETSGLNPVGGITSQIQSVGSQIAGGVNNVTNQFENVGSQITGGFDNATSAITGSNTNAGIQSQLQQLINNLQPNQGSKPPASQQSDTFFQQLGSQFTNAFGTNSANQSSGSNPLGSIASQFQNVGNQITGGFANATNVFAGSSNSANETSGSNPVDAFTSQIQSIGTQIAQGFSNATNTFTGSSNSGGNQSSQAGFAPLDTINSQLQNAGSVFSTGFANTTDAITGSNNNPGIQGQLQQLINSLQSNQSSANNSTGSDPLGGITTQFQNIGSQFAGGFNNVSSAFTGSSNQANQTSGSSPLESIASQFQNLGSQFAGGISNFTGTITGSNNNNPPPANTSQDTGDSSGFNPLGPLTSPFQNIGSQISGGISNATGGLIPNSPFAQLSPSAVSQASNQVVDALKPASVQGQLEGIGSQLQANIPPIYKDEAPAQQQRPEGTSNDIGLISTIESVLNWNTVNQIPFVTDLLGTNNNNVNNNLFPSLAPIVLCPVCTPICGKTNPRMRRDLRIVGGTTLTPTNKYPWIARFTYFGADSGQGSLINDRAVVTTATIAKNMPIYSQVKVLFNVFDLTSTTEQRLVKDVNNVVAHPFFSAQNEYQYNIGVVKLATPVAITSTFMPICLPKLFDSYGGTNAVTVGWGASTPAGATSNVPQELTIPLYTDRECKLSNSQLSHKNLCGGVVKPAPSTAIKATCKGDGGAGLMYPSRFDPTTLTLAGIAIDVPNQGCGEPNQLSVFSETQNYLDFIILYGFGCGC